MHNTITYLHEWHYADDAAGITLPAVLGYAGRIVTATAKVDTGAAFCLFDRDYAELIGLTVEDGIPMVLETLNGTLEAFGHLITLQTLGLTFESTVYFSKYSGLPRNLLGRNGWLRNLRLGLIDYDNRLLLSNYNDE